MAAAKLAPLLLVAGLAALAAGCGDEAVESAETRPPAVEALPARSGSLPLVRRVNGVVRADNQVVVRPEVAGRVVEVLVKSGEAVRQGQPLVRLEPQGLSDQVRQAEADVRLARAAAAEARAEVAELDAEVTRARVLAAEGLVSDMDLETLEARLDATQAASDSAEARVEQAGATLDERRFGLERAVVRAPASGHLGRRGVEVGTIVDPGTALFVLGDLDDLVVEVPLTEGMLAYVEEGQPVAVRPRDDRSAGDGRGPGAGDRVFEANLSRISPFLERGSFTTTGEVDLPGDVSLRPGMFVTVDIRYGESERATLVPATSLWEDPGSGTTGVYVVAEDAGLTPPDDPSPRSEGRRAEDVPDTVRRVAFRPVTVLAEGSGLVGVEGVEPGAWVVTVGQHLLDRQRADAEDEPVTARVRSTSWQQVTALQDLQREDLLQGFVDKQRKLARVFGAELPENEAEAEAALARVSREEAGGADPDPATPDPDTPDAGVSGDTGVKGDPAGDGGS